jgi:tRNA (mo5U34)-methyltransferase
MSTRLSSAWAARSVGRLLSRHGLAVLRRRRTLRPRDDKRPHPHGPRRPRQVPHKVRFACHYRVPMSAEPRQPVTGAVQTPAVPAIRRLLAVRTRVSHAPIAAALAGAWRSLARWHARPRYGREYRLAPLPAGLTPAQLNEYVSRVCWYHQIELGDGVVTPGMKTLADIRREWDLFALNESVPGKSVIDIGGVDGAYAFLAERAGASRAAVLDHYLWSTDPNAYRLIYLAGVDAGQTPPAPHESAAWHPETMPGRWRFDTARQALGSRAEALVLDFMDCDLADVGVWDIVLYLGVLYHMEEPMRALRRVAAVTREQAIIETHAMLLRGHPEALWSFFPGGELNYDRSNWWVPNLGALLGAVGAAGFANAEVLAGESQVDDRPGDGPHYYRAVVRAIK